MAVLPFVIICVTQLCFTVGVGFAGLCRIVKPCFLSIIYVHVFNSSERNEDGGSQKKHTHPLVCVLLAVPACFGINGLHVHVTVMSHILSLLLP